MQSFLKLSVAPEHADALWHTRALSAAVRSRLVTRRWFCAYYDTPSFKLQRHGVALRLRHQGRYWIQTIKRGGEDAAGLHTRIESETKVPAQRLDYPSLVSAGLGELIADSKLRRKIGCVFCTDFVRKSAYVETGPGQRVEVSVDTGEIVSGKRREAVCEIELVLKAGDPTRLFELAMQLADELPVRLDNESKAERGYRLARAKRRQPTKSVRAPISAQSSVDEAFRSIVLGCLRHLQANERGVLESRDPEYLHQARVALRRLGSAFSVFSTAVPKTYFAARLEAFRDLGQAFGDARDWDVFVTETLRSAQSGPMAPLGMSQIKRRAAERRRQARGRACAALSVSEYTLHMLDLAKALVHSDWTRSRDPEQSAAAALPVTQFAQRVLERRHAKVRKRGKNLNVTEYAELHRLRIAIKKLRYACEFLAPLFGNQKTRTYLSRLSALQEILGALNDDATCAPLLDSLAKDPDAAQLRDAVAFLREFAAARTNAGIAALEPAWAEFESADRFW